VQSAANLQQNPVIVAVPTLPTRPTQIASTAPHRLSSARPSRLQKSLPEEIRSALCIIGHRSEYATRMWQLLDHHRNATIAHRAVDPSPISPVRSWLVEDAPQAFYRESWSSVRRPKPKNTSVPPAQHPPSKSQKGLMENRWAGAAEAAAHSGDPGNSLTQPPPIAEPETGSHALG